MDVSQLEQSIKNAFANWSKRDTLLFKQCFEELIPDLGAIEENKLKALMRAVFAYNKEAAYELVMCVMENYSNSLTPPFLSEFFLLNSATDEPEKGFACVFEYTPTKEHAIAMIKAIQTLPKELQNLHFGELHNRKQLFADGQSFFGRCEDLYEDLEGVFQELGLNFSDHVKLEGDAFLVGCREYTGFT